MSPVSDGRRAAGCLLLDRGKQVLLLHRSIAPSQWELPGGKVEGGESAASAAVRELREELGIDVQLTRRLAEVEFEQHDGRWSYVVFLCRKWVGTPEIREPMMFDRIGKFPVSELLSPPRSFSPNLHAFGRLCSEQNVRL
jgi:8-oxo-dGTP diphosphatase